MDEIFTLLIAEDGVKVREGIHKLLNKFRYPLKILEAADGEQARRLLENEPADILMTDVEMPFINGLQLGEIARSMYPDIKIVVFSAHSKFEYARSAISLEAVHYLLKPINVEEFQEVMNRVLDICRRPKNTFPSLFTPDEHDLLFRDIFYGMDFSHDNLSQIPFFADNQVENQYVLYYISLKESFFYSHYKALSEHIEKIENMEKHLFVIDDKQMLIAFKHPYYKPLNINSWHHTFMEWLVTQCPSCAALAICGESGHGIHHIYSELNRILFLKDLQFYIHESTQISTNAQVGVVDTGHAIDIKPFLESINRDIENHDFLSLQDGISALLQVLTVNHQFSSLYVKYLFMGIVNSIYEQVGETLPSKAETFMGALSRTESIDQVRECLDPIFDALDLQQSGGYKSRSVARITQCIQEEYTKDLTLEYLANKVCLTPAYTSTLFKKETGKSITVYINEYRMAKAKSMLRGTNMKLVDIAAAVGYSSQIYFHMLFKKMFGLTPSQYRDGVDLYGRNEKD